MRNTGLKRRGPRHCAPSVYSRSLGPHPMPRPLEASAAYRCPNNWTTRLINRTTTVSSSQHWYSPRNNTSCSKRGERPAAPGLPKGSAGPSLEGFRSAALEGPQTGGWETDWSDTHDEMGACRSSSSPRAVRCFELCCIHGDAVDDHRISDFLFHRLSTRTHDQFGQG